MKQINAYISPNKLNDVVMALAQIDGLSGASTSLVSGFGRSRGRLQLIDFSSHARVEIVCNDALVAQIIETIEQLAKTGYRSAGKIFVSPVEEAVRIETGERGDCVC